MGTGSTVNKFIDALASMKDQIAGAVSSSEASTQRLNALGITVFDANSVPSLGVYIDGADEIDGQGYMVKGGGAALTREKIVAALAQQFVCIADASKLVQTLGAFPLPVEVIPMAAAPDHPPFCRPGRHAQLRMKDGQPLVTDNGQHILDVRGLQITDPLAFECASQPVARRGDGGCICPPKGPGLSAGHPRRRAYAASTNNMLNALWLGFFLVATASALAQWLLGGRRRCLPPWCRPCLPWPSCRSRLWCCSLAP